MGLTITGSLTGRNGEFYDGCYARIDHYGLIKSLGYVTTTIGFYKSKEEAEPAFPTYQEDYADSDVITDDKGNVYTKFLDENGRILNVIPPNPKTTNVEPVTDFPELTITTTTGFGAILQAQILPRPEYQGEIKQVIDCISPRDGIVGYVNGEAYYGSFHVMPNGLKMTGAKHSDSDFIIYDTPQQSRTSATTTSTKSTTMTTVSSPQVSYNTSTPTTTTPSMPTPSTPTQSDSSDDSESTPPSSPPSSPPSNPGYTY